MLSPKQLRAMWAERCEDTVRVYCVGITKKLNGGKNVELGILENGQGQTGSDVSRE